MSSCWSDCLPIRWTRATSCTIHIYSWALDLKFMQVFPDQSWIKVVCQWTSSIFRESLISSAQVVWPYQCTPLSTRPSSPIFVISVILAWSVIFEISPMLESHMMRIFTWFSIKSILRRFLQNCWKRDFSSEIRLYPDLCRLTPPR